jgi:hypothetical protein
MSGTTPLLPIYAFVGLTGKTLLYLRIKEWADLHRTLANEKNITAIFRNMMVLHTMYCVSQVLF